jgi:2-polyprenyl-6-methoxyphenol hydroxylase-like FAD-dependent oxidoreductase
MTPEDFASALTQASHSALGQVTASTDRVVWPLVRAQAGQWAGEMPGQSGQAWVLAGDAAHAVHPLAGQGLNLGLADAAELSRVVGEREYWRDLSDMRLLRRYERSRRAALLAAGGVMDGLQQAFTRDEPGVASVRNWGMQAFDKSGPLKRWVAQRAMGLG